MNNALSIDEIVSFEKTYSFSRAAEGEGEYRHIHYGDIHTKLPSVVEDSKILPQITEEKDFQVIEKGDILVADASEDYKDLGKAVCYAGNDTKVIAGLHTHLLRCNKKIVNPQYLINLFQTNRYKKYVWRMGTGVSVLGLSKNNLSKYEVYLPTLDEQHKIAKFFNILNKKIQLQQQKIDLLQEQKKGFLQKMFPKAGETQPEMRLAGFTGDWEQRKLGEVANIFDGTHQTPKYTATGVKFVSVENIATLETNKFISQEAYDKEYSKKQAEKGDILMTRIGDIGTAKVIETEESLAYYVTLALLKPNKVDSDFLAWLISSPEVKRNIWKRTLHIAFPKKINLGEINKIEMMVPNNEEQTKIGAFFKQLDYTIALHQQKITTLKEQKKGFMQQMFI